MASSANSVITRARRVNLAKITSGAVESIPKITHIAFGDQGVDGEGQPLQPTADQQTLNHEVGRYEIDSVTNPAETTNRYTVTVPEAGLVGTNISEMALIDSEGVFAAVKNLLPKGKDADVKFTFEFDDEFGIVQTTEIIICVPPPPGRGNTKNSSERTLPRVLGD